MDALLILNCKDDVPNKKKTNAVNVWLFGYEFLDTLLIITKRSFIFIGSAKKCILFFYEKFYYIYIFFFLLFFFI